MTTYEPWSASRANEVIALHAQKQGATLPILHALQQTFGYVPLEAEPLIADALNVTRAEIHGVVTFYHDFRRSPPGRRLIRICRAEACQSRGADALAKRAQERLKISFGETSADGGVTLEAAYCLGLCAVAPAAFSDSQPVGRLDAEKLDALLAESGA